MSTTVFFDGDRINTTVTDNAAEIDAWVRHIRINNSSPQVIVGLDCEWRPNMSTYVNNRTAILQLCAGTDCLIVQLKYLDYIPQSLRYFLRDSRFTFVGVEVQRDVTKLETEYGLTCTNIADVRELTLSMWPGIYLPNPGLQGIARELLGLSIPKPRGVRLSNWEARYLDPTQIEYACIDAYASFRIGHYLLKEV